MKVESIRNKKRKFFSSDWTPLHYTKKDFYKNNQSSHWNVWLSHNNDSYPPIRIPPTSTYGFFFKIFLLFLLHVSIESSRDLYSFKHDHLSLCSLNQPLLHSKTNFHTKNYSNLFNQSKTYPNLVRIVLLKIILESHIHTHVTMNIEFYMHK